MSPKPVTLDPALLQSHIDEMTKTQLALEKLEAKRVGYEKAAQRELILQAEMEREIESLQEEIVASKDPSESTLHTENKTGTDFSIRSYQTSERGVCGVHYCQSRQSLYYNPDISFADRFSRENSGQQKQAEMMVVGIRSRILLPSDLDKRTWSISSLYTLYMYRLHLYNSELLYSLPLSKWSFNRRLARVECNSPTGTNPIY
jgi:hypothetical protein